MCCDGWKFKDDEVNGSCPECGGPTVDGEAQEGCNYSSVDCEECEASVCDDSC